MEQEQNKLRAGTGTTASSKISADSAHGRSAIMEQEQNKLRAGMIEQEQEQNKLRAGTMDRSGIHSVEKAFALLACLAEAGGSLTLKDLSARTGFPKSTTHNLLSTMRGFRAIEQDGDGRYRLGTRLFELGSAVERQWDITTLAKPYLQSISSQLGELACVAMWDEGSMLVLDTAVSPGSMRFVIEVGARLPLHSTSFGKAVLAYRPEAAEALLRAGPASFTPHTICTAQALAEELARVKISGVALEDGEMRVGMRSAAAPIFDVNGQARYAIGVTGMFRQTSDRAFEAAQKLVADAAREISGVIGAKL